MQVEVEGRVGAKYYKKTYKITRFIICQRWDGGGGKRGRALFFPLSTRAPGLHMIVPSY